MFKRKNKNKSITDMSIENILDNIKHCSAINNSSIIKEIKEGVNDKFWLNPINQDCFNSGNFFKSDFIDWQMVQVK